MKSAGLWGREDDDDDDEDEDWGEMGCWLVSRSWGGVEGEVDGAKKSLLDVMLGWKQRRASEKRLYNVVQLPYQL